MASAVKVQELSTNPESKDIHDQSEEEEEIDEEDEEEDEEDDAEPVFTSATYSYRDNPKNYDAYGNLCVKSLSCDTVRMKINTFLATKEMTQKAFMDKIDVSSSSYHRFMSYKGKFRGSDNSTYYNALKFFAERDMKEKLKKKEEKEEMKKQAKAAKKEQAGSGAKKRKQSEISAGEVATDKAFPEPKTSKRASKEEAVDSLLNELSSIEPESRRVYDDCDDIRTNIATMIKGPNWLMTMARFSKAIGVSPGAVNKFLAKKGFNEGAGSSVYYDSYIFFEKLRLLRKQPKTAKRMRNEKKHPEGFPLVDPPRPAKYYWVIPGVN